MCRFFWKIATVYKSRNILVFNANGYSISLSFYKNQSTLFAFSFLDISAQRFLELDTKLPVTRAFPRQVVQRVRAVWKGYECLHVSKQDVFKWCYIKSCDWCTVTTSQGAARFVFSVSHSNLYTVDFPCLELFLSRTFCISNFLYLELSLSRTISISNFPYLEHSLSRTFNTDRSFCLSF